MEENHLFLFNFSEKLQNILYVFPTIWGFLIITRNIKASFWKFSTNCLQTCKISKISRNLAKFVVLEKLFENRTHAFWNLLVKYDKIINFWIFQKRHFCRYIGKVSKSILAIAPWLSLSTLTNGLVIFSQRTADFLILGNFSKISHNLYFCSQIIWS